MSIRLIFEGTVLLDLRVNKLNFPVMRQKCRLILKINSAALSFAIDLFELTALG